MINPFNVTFGKTPLSGIDRSQERKLVEDTFQEENPSSQTFILTGPRGSGKTVLLTKISSDLEKEGFLAVDLNPYLEMEEQLASKLYEEGKLQKFFLKPEFSFSFKGISFSLSGETPVSNVLSLTERMLEYLQKKGKRLLITIDDVSVSSNMKSFVFSFQQWLRADYPVFLLMSGLYENVSELSKEKSLTFLLRAPKINLKPLPLISVYSSYKEYLNISDEQAAELAKLTAGYAYGYQLLGNMVYSRTEPNKIISEYDKNLWENSYILIWDKLTGKEKDFLKAMAKSPLQKDIRESLKMNNGNLQTYKKRLIDKGIIFSSSRGEIGFALPRFKEFVKTQEMLED